ncbi:hypothetical protein HGRIS_006915 [Hohenbuehelia grisea]|uniref:Uncharacterized protein n=1 Tax=Hohenbuehelia grisea TaxID=104357 RepID=A0ABR3JAV2_9AGAR
MANKALSKGTLSLRFMQNAHRAKQLKEVELDKAQVKDDAEWQVSESVREAWGIGQTQSTSPQITYETSYLPFVLSSESSTTHASSATSFDHKEAQTASDAQFSAPKAQGRRTFKSGKEVYPQEDVASVPKQHSANEPSTSPAQGKKYVKPSHISGHYTPRELHLNHRLPKIIATSKAKRAQDAIFDSSGTGVDLPRPTLSSSVEAGIAANSIESSAASEGFLKPAGVDEPTKLASTSVNTSAELVRDFPCLAVQMPSYHLEIQVDEDNRGTAKSESRTSRPTKRERNHDAGSDRPDEERKKRKKRKAVSEAGP